MIPLWQEAIVGVIGAAALSSAVRWERRSPVVLDDLTSPAVDPFDLGPIDDLFIFPALPDPSPEFRVIAGGAANAHRGVSPLVTTLPSPAHSSTAPGAGRSNAGEGVRRRREGSQLSPPASIPPPSPATSSPGVLSPRVNAATALLHRVPDPAVAASSSSRTRAPERVRAEVSVGLGGPVRSPVGTGASVGTPARPLTTTHTFPCSVDFPEA